MRDITARKAAEAVLQQAKEALERQTTELQAVNAQLRAAGQEKEVLLKEVHHRVKNNLQIISSLLNLQAESLPDSEGRALYRDSQRRVRAMALIHARRAGAWLLSVTQGVAAARVVCSRLRGCQSGLHMTNRL